MFLALSRARTVHQAAAALGVDASTVSRRLASLEQGLDAPLFHRGRDGIHPTEEAEVLLPVAEEIEDAIRRFATAAESREREASGVVRITCPPDVAEVVVAPLLGELVSRYPSLRIALEPSEAVVDLARREADLALRVVRPSGGDLVMTRVTSVGWTLAAAPQVARSLGTLRRWSDAPWVGWGDRFKGIPAARWLARHLRGTEPIARSDSLMVQLALMKNAVGIGLVPEPTAAHHQLGAVKIGAALREAAAEWPRDDLFLVTHRALQNVPRVRVVWDLILARWGERT
jgi:DNA-binding transcriptional LysR family regulator